MLGTMTWFTILLVLQVLLCATPFVDSQLALECPTGYIQKDTYCYRKVYATFSWEMADDACERDGSRLVWIEDWNENEYVHSLLDMGQEMYWTGLKKMDGDWKWTGSSEVYDLRLGFWEPSQPDASNSGPECVAGMVDGDWKRVPCMKKLPFICKTPAYPPGSFKCSKGLKAISGNWKCDGCRDCEDKSDEVDCDTAPYCNWYSTTMPGSKSINYEGSKTCLYTLKANIGERISLTISSQSAIELKADSLKVYSGGLTLSESYLIGTVKGSLSTGQRFISGNHFLIIRMTTDSSVERRPISMSWTNVVPEITNSPRELTGTSSYGTLTSPFFGGTLPPALESEWVITAQSAGEIITLMFDVVNLESKSSLSVYDGDMANAVLTDVRSIPDPAMYISYSKSVKIRLSTYTAIQPPNSGFVIRYKQGCAITINPANYGTIMTPGFQAGKYPRNVACSWELTAPTMKKLTLRSRSFNLFENIDFMKVYNATDATATSYTGQIFSPLRLLSDAGYFKIEFTSDNVRTGVGFELRYSIDCEPWMPSQETNIAYSEMPYTSFESSISVTCKNGYSFMQEEYNTMAAVPMVCEEGGKWNVSRNPDCRITHCPIPPKISNGWIESASGTVEFGSNVTYMCENGFVLIGSANIKCKADGTWEDAPSCTSTSCSILPTVVNGNTRNLTATQNKYGDVIEYYCNEGYETVGPSFAYCQTNGTWSHSVPTCKALTCPLVPVMNAFWTREDGVPFGSSGMLNCSDGYKWNMTNSQVISVTCQANGTFLNIDDCVDIDECKDVPNSCSALEDCDNTIGSFKCSCKDGYFRNSTSSLCQDILECSVNKGGCSNTCNEASPGYSCSCPSGYELFTESNQNNITLAKSETGLRQGDIYYFNHTCVRKTCDALYHPSNGQRLTEDAYTFYYEDEVNFVCNIGYKLVGSKNVTCEANGQWSASPPTCTRQVCTVPAHKARMLNSSIAPAGTAYLGDAVVFQCQYGNQVLDRKMYCSYIGNGQYDWQGDDYSCPEINCGEPTVVPAGDYSSKTGNSWKDTFEFGCESGFTKSGNSTNENSTVTCQENGRWGFGSLTCTGDLCTDPGTPYDAQQVATSYEVGQTVTWTCNRNGYTPDPPTVLLCQIVGSVVNWNSTERPSCKDTENPTFTSCPTETIYVHKSHPVVYTAPTANDNTNQLKSVTVQPENIESGSIINQNTTIIYTAEDYTGNTGTCEINVVVIENVIPSLSCPNSSVYYINTTNGYSVNPLDLVSSAHPWASLTAVPSSVTVNFNSLGVLQKVRVTASYETVTSSCSFVIATEASTCLTESIPSIAFAGKSCTGNNQCTVDCKSVQGVQYFHSDTGLIEKQYNCTGANNWSPAISDTTCVTHDNAEYSMTVEAPFETSNSAVNCLAAFKVQIPAFYNLFESRYGCQSFIDGTVVRDEKVEVGSSNKILLNITINLDRAAPDTDKESCLASFSALLSVNQVSPLRFFPQSISCTTGTSTVTPLYTEAKVISSGYSCSTRGRVLNTENKCVPTVPGTFEENGVSVNCTDGLYQDNVGQTSCKQCPDGSVPAATRDTCLNTCLRGFVSDDGFPPCRPCPKDCYWSNSTYCEKCPANTSTVEQNGMEVLGDCKAECQAGMFSPTGYEPCKPCPQNFYQALTGQKECMECAATQTTNSTGSNSSSQCWTPDLCPASPTTCSGNGTCSVKNHEKFCSCSPGYYGSDCQSMNNFCNENPCVKGTCSNVQGTSFTCTCEPGGFTGDRCDRDSTNRCTSNPCKAGSCRNIKDGTDCLCPLTGGFTQPNCDRLANLCDGVSCSGRGSCVAFGSVRKQCICQPGFTGENCETNINECALNPQGCLYNSTCNDGTNAYSCQCRSGFSGDRCQVRNDFCRTDQCSNAECYNDYDSFKSVCVCHDGFEVTNAGNGKCTAKATCPLGNAVCNNGTCRDDECFCLSGYTGSQCQHDFTDCTMNSCKNGGTCVDKLLGYDCNCMSGYTGDDCSRNIDDCLGQCQGEHVVSTGERCMDKVNDFMCNCEAGWTGKNCTENIDECASYPCRHGAGCTDGDNDYTCNCTTGWTGKNCDTAINNCPVNTCNNEGKCFNMNDDFFCSCLGGTTGKTCSNFPPVCNIIKPCTTQGNCVDEEGTAKCDCKSNSYTGSSCQMTTYHCATKPCKNDGTCVTGSGMDFSCTCRNSFSGATCEGYTNPCNTNPCTPGASCMSDKDKYLCYCPGGGIPTDTQCKSSPTLGEVSVDGNVDTKGTYLNNPFVFTNTDMFSVMLRVLCSNDTYSNPIILALEEREIDHQEPGWMDSPPTSKYLLKMTNEGVVLNNGTDYKMVEFGKNICDKIWHHVSVTYHKNGTTYVKLDSTPKDPFTVTVPGSFSKVFQVLLGQSFLGKISQVMIWNTILSDTDQLLAFDNVNNIPDKNEIVQNWMNYAATKSVKFSPVINVNDNVLKDEMQMTGEKKPPVVVSCPSYRKELPMSNEQIVNIPGLKNSISYTHSTDITKHSSVADGESYTRGRFNLVFYAIDAMKNFAMCRFPLYIQYADCPAPVFNGVLTDFSVGSNMKAHTASCQTSNLAISGPIPEYFHCTNLGVYDPNEPNDSVNLPACGVIGTTWYEVAVDLQYDLIISCSSADTTTFANTLRERLKNAGVCNNNCEVITNLRCDTPSGKLLRVSFTLTGLEQTLSITVNGAIVSFTPLEALTHVVYYTDAMDFQHVVGGAVLRKNVQSIAIAQSLSCVSGYQLVGEQCVQCSSGQYYDSNTKMCKFCQKNTYTDEAGQTSCKPCDGNKVTLNDGATSQSLCVENCTAGYFYNMSSTSCQMCAKNFYQENSGLDYCNFCPIQKITTGTGSSSFADCNDDCPVGQERVQSNQACVKCPVGMYRTQLNVKCVPCSSEFTTEGEGTTDESGCDIRICYNGTFRNKTNLCEDCAIGYYQDENFKDECKKCPISESTRNMGSNSSSQCEFVCGAGEEIINGTKSCKKCDRSLYHTGDYPDIFSPCKECPTNKTTEITGSTHEDNCTIVICAKGQEVNSSADICIDCPYNTFQDKDMPASHQRCVDCGGSKATRYMKTTSLNDCHFYCPLAGTQDDGNDNCVSCPRGTFRSVDDHSTTFSPCENCTAGRTTEGQGSISSHNCSIDICSKGQELNSSGSCLDCPYDYYQDIEMPTSMEKCKPCDPNKATETMNSTSSSDCKRFCKEPGTELNNQDMCVPCARGTYRSVDDRTTYFTPCMNCSNGGTTEGSGSISSLNCSIDMCSAGEVLDSNGNCNRCPKNEYQPITYPNSAVTCTKCPSDKATMLDGQTSIDSCVRVCSAGQQYNNVSDQCEPCGKGTWNNANETMKFQQCASCHVNYTTTGESSTDIRNCTLLDCDPGSYISGDNCLLCPLGTYQPDRHQTSCINCGSNQNTSATGRTMKSECQIWCGPGLAGSTVCQKCSPDTIKPEAGLSQCVSCEEGFANFTSNDNRTACDVLFCDRGFKYNGTSSPARCDPCKQGEYKETRGRATSCTPCGPGFTTSGEASRNSTNCDQPYCVIGKFYNSTDQSCQLCPIGSFKNTVGNTDCTLCPPSFTTSVTGATSSGVCTVVVCPAGKKRNAITNTCEDCPIGWYQPDQGQSTCIQCSPVTYTTRTTATVSQSGCVDNCDPGYEFNATTGMCVACGLGTYKSENGNWQSDRTTLITCSACSPLKTTPSTASTSPNDCSLDLCDVGTYQKDGACVSCEKGTYQDEKGQTQCKPCGGTKTTKALSGATSIDDCIPFCPLGKNYNFSSPDCCCTDCPVSYYIDKSVGEFCIKCPAGTTNVSPGSTDCGFTDSTPVVTERVSVRFRLRLFVPSFDCSDANSKNIYANNVKLKLIVRLKALRFDICVNPSCNNVDSIVVVFPTSGGCNPQASSGRRKRAAGPTVVDLDVTANSLPDPATSSDNTALRRPIQDLMTDMLNTNPSSIAPQGSTLQAASVTNVTPQCSPGHQLDGTSCKVCPMGTYESLGSCINCALNRYQDETGQTTCKECSSSSSIKIYTAGTNSTSLSQCLSTCEVNSNYCKNGGECVADQTVYCKCASRYSGTTCENRSEPDDSTWIYIVAGTIGGLVFLLIIIIIIVVFCRRSSSPKTKIVYEKQDPSHSNRGYQSYPEGYPYQQAMMSQHAMTQALPESYYLPYQQPYQQPRAITNRQYRGFEVDEDNSSGYKWTSFSEH